MISKNINSYKIICTKSTVPVGTGKMIEKILLKNNDITDFDYVSNPEFLREGSAVKDFLIPDRLVIGAKSEKAFSIMKEVYRPFFVNETPLIIFFVDTFFLFVIKEPDKFLNEARTSISILLSLAS